MKDIFDLRPMSLDNGLAGEAHIQDFQNGTIYCGIPPVRQKECNKYLELSVFGL